MLKKALFVSVVLGAVGLSISPALAGGPHIGIGIGIGVPAYAPGPHYYRYPYGYPYWLPISIRPRPTLSRNQVYVTPPPGTYVQPAAYSQQFYYTPSAPAPAGTAAWSGAAANVCVRLRADVFVEFGVRVSAASRQPLRCRRRLPPILFPTLLPPRFPPGTDCNVVSHAIRHVCRTLEFRPLGGISRLSRNSDRYGNQGLSGKDRSPTRHPLAGCPVGLQYRL